jgi:cobalt-zinc-cadmium efflux system protein
MHHHNHHVENRNIRNIKFAIIVNIALSFVELAGGIMSNSISIISNAVHDMGDSIAFSFSYFSEKYANTENINENYTYRLNRLPLLSALVNSIILLTGSVIILYNTIPRLFEPETPRADIMFFIAIIGIVANSIALIKLKRNEGINSKVLSLHTLEDFLGWIAIFIGSIIITYFNFPIIDPLLSVIITVYILFGVLRNIRVVYRLFMQKSPESINTADIMTFIKSFNEVKSVEDLHIWSLEGTHHVLTAHIQVSDEISTGDLRNLKNEIREGIKKFGYIHSTLEIERESEICDDHC